MKPISQVKRELEAKYRQHRVVLKKIEMLQATAYPAKRKGISSASAMAEERLARAKAEAKQIYEEMVKLELEAYGTWLPRAKVAREMSEAGKRNSEIEAELRSMDRKAALAMNKEDKGTCQDQGSGTETGDLLSPAESSTSASETEDLPS
mgnify:FL=1